jgi:hypothetical protein
MKARILLCKPQISRKVYLPGPPHLVANRRTALYRYLLQTYLRSLQTYRDPRIGLTEPLIGSVGSLIGGMLGRAICQYV